MTVTLLIVLTLLIILINKINNNNKKKIKFASSSSTCVTNAVVTVSTLDESKNTYIFYINTIQLIIQVACDYFDNMSSESQQLLSDDPLSFFKSNFRITGKLKANSWYNPEFIKMCNDWANFTRMKETREFLRNLNLFSNLNDILKTGMNGIWEFNFKPRNVFSRAHMDIISDCLGTKRPFMPTNRIVNGIDITTQSWLSDQISQSVVNTIINFENGNMDFPPQSAEKIEQTFEKVQYYYSNIDTTRLLNFVDYNSLDGNGYTREQVVQSIVESTARDIVRRQHHDDLIALVNLLPRR